MTAKSAYLQIRGDIVIGSHAMVDVRAIPRMPHKTTASGTAEPRDAVYEQHRTRRRTRVCTHTRCGTQDWPWYRCDARHNQMLLVDHVPVFSHSRLKSGTEKKGDPCPMRISAQP